MGALWQQSSSWFFVKLVGSIAFDSLLKILTLNFARVEYLRVALIYQFILPHFMLICASFALVILSTFRSFLIGPVLLVLDRLDEAPKGVLTTLALFFVALGALITAYVRASS